MIKEPKNKNGFKYFESYGYLPRVSTILKIISKGDYFDKWLKKEGDNADVLSAKACDTGTGWHNILEKIGKGETITPETYTPLENIWLKAFLEWKNKNIKVFVSTEKPIYHPEDLYCGTLDALAILQDEQIIVLDYKTSARCYKTYFLQIAAYIRAVEKMEGVRLNGAKILRFNKKAETEGKPMEVIDVPDIDDHYEVFKHALAIWRWENKNIYKED